VTSFERQLAPLLLFLDRTINQMISHYSTMIMLHQYDETKSCDCDCDRINQSTNPSTAQLNQPVMDNSDPDFAVAKPRPTQCSRSPGERHRKKRRSTIFLERTIKDQRQSCHHWQLLQRQRWETFQQRGGVKRVWAFPTS